MLKVSFNTNSPIFQSTADRQLLSEMAERSKIVMAEFGEIFKSKTLETLYTPEYRYKGILPKTTYIIDKKTGKKKLMFITEEKTRTREGVSEVYTGKTFGLKKLGDKSFKTRGNRIGTGVMESKANDRYAGTQIRLTQIEVERAMQIGANYIPLVSLAEALPFHTMMGFRPNETSMKVSTVEEVNKLLKKMQQENITINKAHFTPIIHEKYENFYFDENQTFANALLRQLKEDANNGVKRNFHTIYPANDVKMNLSGNELEDWKQRALSQPILLKK